MQDNTKHTYTHYEDVNLDTFDKKIQVIEKVKTNGSTEFDEDGNPIGQVEKEIIVRECWASFRRTTGTEAVKANADFNTMKCRFLVRSSKTKITDKMFIRYKEQDYNIIFVNDYRDDHLITEIWCEIVSNCL